MVSPSLQGRNHVNMYIEFIKEISSDFEIFRRDSMSGLADMI